MSFVLCSSVIVVVLSILIFLFLDRENQLTKLIPHGHTKCSKITGMPGAEDFVFLDKYDDEILIVSSDDRSWYPKSPLGGNITANMIRHSENPNKKQSGFFSLDVSSSSALPSPHIIQLIDFPHNLDFHPHGISILETKSASLLFAVVHSRYGELVCIFSLTFSAPVDGRRARGHPVSARYIGHIEKPEFFLSLNDLAAFTVDVNVNHDKDAESESETVGFYVTNWLGASIGSFWSPLFLLSRQRVGSVVACTLTLSLSQSQSDNIQDLVCDYVLKDVSPNGIQMTNMLLPIDDSDNDSDSNDNSSLVNTQVVVIADFHDVALRVARHVVTSSSSSSSIKVHNLNENGVVRLIPLPFKTYIDNIMVSNTNEIYIGAHPKGLEFSLHKDSPNFERICPSQILRVSPNSSSLSSPSSFSSWSSSWSVSEIYLSNGEELSASSVGFVHQGRLYIGSVFWDGVLSCEAQ